jgi:hypothetical protein
MEENFGVFRGPCTGTTFQLFQFLLPVFNSYKIRVVAGAQLISKNEEVRTTVRKSEKEREKGVRECTGRGEGKGERW